MTRLDRLRQTYTSALDPDLRWWGVPKMGWNVRTAPAMLQSLPRAELDSHRAAAAASWTGNGAQHTLGLKLSGKAASAPFLVAKDSLARSPFDRLPSVLVSCAPLFR